MTMMLNGRHPMPVQMLQFMRDGGAVLPVRDDPDRAGALLDDYDTAIAALDHALNERNAAAALWDDADRRVRIILERCQLAKLALKSESFTREVRGWQTTRR